MDEQTKRKRAGTIVGLVGLVTTILWLATGAHWLSWQPSDGVRIFLVVVGPALLLAGILVARSRAPSGGRPPNQRLPLAGA